MKPEREKHKGLETWQVVVGIAGVIVGLLVYLKKEQPSAQGPAQLEVPGYGASGGSESFAGPKQPSLTGEQGTKAGSPLPHKAEGPLPPVEQKIQEGEKEIARPPALKKQPSSPAPTLPEVEHIHAGGPGPPENPIEKIIAREKPGFVPQGPDTPIVPTPSPPPTATPPILKGPIVTPPIIRLPPRRVLD